MFKFEKAVDHIRPDCLTFYRIRMFDIWELQATRQRQSKSSD